VLKRVVGAEQDAEFGKSFEVVWEGAELIAAEVEDLQGVGEIENFLGKLGQVTSKVQACGTDEVAFAK
jgi:hypothetical protein